MNKFIISGSLFWFTLIFLMSLTLPDSADKNLFMSYFLFLWFTVCPMAFVLGIKLLGLGDKNDG